ncbi:hypothetical protein BC937DRAFT_87116 [Endogone sp. FLAS-F59071]|nr:hypothetical protein BC937DRAFT_87116 [Endogone sp. FLAS-F59071]|eukprot:RUS19673.1 hypothetical protein BC937DRAFT_87116 [Endogone sp. FLAS-F59071]
MDGHTEQLSSVRVSHFNEKKGYFGSTKKSKLDPSDFRHLSHIGWDPNKGFSAQNIDPSWRALFDQLVQLDVTEDQIAADADLIQKFVAQHGGPEPQAAQPASPSVKASAPPPPPPSKKQAPPPPPPSSGK